MNTLLTELAELISRGVLLLGTAFLVLLFLFFMLIGSGQAEKKVRQAFPTDMAERIGRRLELLLSH